MNGDLGMVGDKQARLTRVDLGNGRWALMRPAQLRDLRAMRLERYRRGFDSPDLDALYILPRLIVGSGRVSKEVTNG